MLRGAMSRRTSCPANFVASGKPERTRKLLSQKVCVNRRKKGIPRLTQTSPWESDTTVSQPSAMASGVVRVCAVSPIEVSIIGGATHLRLESTRVLAFPRA